MEEVGGSNQLGYSRDSITGDPVPNESINGAASVIDGHLESRMDDTTDPAWIYFGSAIPGSLNAAAVWVVSRMDTATNNVYYADGDSKYDNIWNDRATLTYSTGV